jgi:ATP-dependent helicase HrpB
MDEARARLAQLGAIGPDGRPTAHGRAVAALPLPVRLAHMLIEAEERGCGALAAEVAVLLSERGLGGSDTDLELRLRRWRGDRGRRAQAGRGLARNWLRMASPPAGGKGSRGGAVDAGGARAGTGPPAPPESGRGEEVGQCVALAFPDRVSRRRNPSGEEWLSVGGRGFRLDPASPLAREEWLAVAEVAGTAGGARILSAAAIAQAQVEELFASRIASGSQVSFDVEARGVRASHGRRLGAIQLSGGHDSRADPAAIEAALLEGVRRHGLGLLPWSGEGEALRRRIAFARRVDPALPDLSDEALLARIEEWLPPLLSGKRRLTEITPAALAGALEALLGWDACRQLERLAPAAFVTPAGSRHAIDYQAEAGPTVSVRVQALFGLSEHPSIAGGAVPLILALTSPAGRPIQTTGDLPGFWRGSWSAVAREMRGRCPRHPWPDDPAAADPTLRTKRASQRPV